MDYLNKRLINYRDESFEGNDGLVDRFMLTLVDENYVLELIFA